MICREGLDLAQVLRGGAVGIRELVPAEVTRLAWPQICGDADPLGRIGGPSPRRARQRGPLAPGDRGTRGRRCIWHERPSPTRRRRSRSGSTAESATRRPLSSKGNRTQDITKAPDKGYLEKAEMAYRRSSRPRREAYLFGT